MNPERFFAKLFDRIDRITPTRAIFAIAALWLFLGAGVSAGVYLFNSNGSGACSATDVCAASVPIDANGNPLTSLPGAAPAGAAFATQGIPVTTYFFQPAASNNATNVKSTAGFVYWVLAENNSATVNYLRLYNSGGSPTCTSATGLITQIQIPASTTVGGININLHYPIPFGNGIAFCLTSGYSTTDNTNATATAMSITIGYN